MKRKFIWIVLTVAIVLIGFHVAKMLMFHNEPVMFSKEVMHGQAFNGPHFKQGGMEGFGGQPGHMMKGHREMVKGPTPGLMGNSGRFVGNVFSVLFPLALAILGWVLFKLGKKGTIKRIIGAILLFLGLWALLPKWLIILGLLGMGYYFYKTRKEPVYSPAGFGDFTNVPSQTVDFLDEWEMRINKEGNNNGNL
jgi:hypothetical protein